MTLIINLPDSEPKTYQRLDAAMAFADRFVTEHGGELEVVDSDTNSVAYLTSQKAIAKRDEGVWFTPFTRLETPKFTAPDISGFYPAYTRRRIEAVVYRAYDTDAEQGWLVWDGREGAKGTKLCSNTTESRKLLTAMRHGLMLTEREVALR